jgi:hypothetical protein
MMKTYNSREDWANDQAAPWKQKFYELEIQATAARAAGNTDEERLIRQKTAKIRQHIERYEALK